MNNKEKIETTAIRLANESGLINLTRSQLCTEVNIPDGSFNHLMGCSFTEFIEKLKPLVTSGNISKVTKKRVSKELRKDSILSSAILVAKEVGFDKVTRDQVAEQAGISTGLVHHHFSTMVQLKRALMRHAIKDGILEIIAQGLAVHDEQAKKAPRELQLRAVEQLAESI